MKFVCSEYQNGKPYEWEKYTRNPFNHYYIHHMVLTSVQNDRVLRKEFEKLIKLGKYDDLAYYDCECKKLKWIKQFKETKYTVATVHVKELEKFRKFGFYIECMDTMPDYFIMIRKNY